MAISTYNEFDKMFGTVIGEVIEAVSVRAKKLLVEHINSDTYGINKTTKGKPKINKSYLNGTGRPSYEFRDKAWDITVKKKVTESVFTLFYDGSKMSPQSKGNQYLHGYYGQGEVIDRRNELASILNVSGIAERSDMHSDKHTEPFWDNFENELNQKIGGWLYTEFNNRGIKIPALKLYKGSFTG